MITRNEVLAKAVIECIQTMYKYATPSVTWEQFLKDNKELKEKNLPNTPSPYQYYYLPEQILTDIVDNFVEAYNIGNKQCTFKDSIETIKEYIKNPKENGYDEELNCRSVKEIIPLEDIIGKEHHEEVIKYLDKASNYYRFGEKELNAFYMEVYLGAAPSSNRDSVIKNWKKYTGKDVVLKSDEEIIKSYEEESC